MTDFIPLLLFPLDSPSKKGDKKDSYSHASQGIILNIISCETHVKPIFLDYDWVYTLLFIPTQ